MKLDNPDFVGKAPVAVVEKIRGRLSRAEADIARISPNSIGYLRRDRRRRRRAALQRVERRSRALVGVAHRPLARPDAHSWTFWESRKPVPRGPGRWNKREDEHRTDGGGLLRGFAATGRYTSHTSVDARADRLDGEPRG